MSLQDSRVKTKALFLHNQYREEHGGKPLQWSYELQKVAREHAMLLALREEGEPLSEKEDVTWGQNIFEVRRPKEAGLEELSETEVVERAIKCWYDDIKHYDWTNPPGSTSALSFTQIVWLDCEKLGLGVGRMRDRVVVCCLYNPGGNFRGEFLKNVLPKITCKEDATPWRTSSKSMTSTSTVTVTPVKNIPASVPKPLSQSSPVQKIQLPSSKPKVKVEVKRNSLDDMTLGPVPKLLTTALDLHNQFRKKHRTPSLKLDPKLCIQAQNYAQSIVDGTGMREGVSSLGKNVFRFAGSLGKTIGPGEVMRKAVNTWYQSKKDYNWSAPLASAANARLFSQLVWKGSKEIGFGLASGGETVAVVALYSPMGNSESEHGYTENVRPALY